MNLLKPTALLGVISTTILLTPFASQALTVEEVTNPQTTNNAWVTDMADILSDDAETKLNQIISNLEKTNGTEIAVVTVPETVPADSPKTFATQLFNYWGIGKAKSNNGILFLISTGDNRVEIETGYGIEAILPNTQVSKIINTKITPQYKQGNFDGGTIDGTKALISSLDSPLPKEKISVRQDSGNNFFPSWAGIVIGIGMGIGITSIKKLIKSKNEIYKVLIEPTKAITNLDRQDFRDIYCAKCKQPMEKVNEISLSEVQKVAKKIGSVSYRGYKCTNCNHDLQPYSLIAYVSSSSRYQKCPECDDFTIIRTEETLEEPTTNTKGKNLIIDTCHCCNYSQEKTEIIPTLRRNDTKNRYVDRTGLLGVGFYGGGHGGGYSGGGGAGGGW